MSCEFSTPIRTNMDLSLLNDTDLPVMEVKIFSRDLGEYDLNSIDDWFV